MRLEIRLWERTQMWRNGEGRPFLPLSIVFYFGLMNFVSKAGWGQSATTPLTMDYTGALFGFFQINDPDPASYPPPVARFLDRRKTTAGRLLVGMGDNFGPEFRASIQPVTDAGDPGCNMPLSRAALHPGHEEQTRSNRGGVH
jgi:hypothetical protein